MYFLWPDYTKTTLSCSAGGNCFDLVTKNELLRGKDNTWYSSERSTSLRVNVQLVVDIFLSLIVII